MARSTSKEWPVVKPYPSFPLTPHARGWVKKIGGKVRHVCGKLPADEALAYWEANAPALRLRWGLPPDGSARPRVDGPTVADVAAYWLGGQQEALLSGKLTPSYFGECRDAVGLVLDHLGRHEPAEVIGPAAFRVLRAGVFAKAKGERTRRLMLSLAKTMFRAAADDEVIDRVPAFGRSFMADLRAPDHRLTGRRGRDKMFDRAEVRALLRAAGRGVGRSSIAGRGGGVHSRMRESAVQIRAMVWLAINGGYHAGELAQLPVAALHLKAGSFGRVDEWRPKTDVDHLVPLWPETRAALDVVLQRLAETRPGDELLFRTSRGLPWVRDDLVVDDDGAPVGGSKQSAVAQAFAKLKAAAGIKAPGKGIHGVRHTHRSISGGAGDPVAARTVSGHKPSGIDAIYEHPPWSRLEKVSGHVREWLRDG